MVLPGVIASGRTTQATGAVRFSGSTMGYSTSLSGLQGGSWTVTCWANVRVDRNTFSTFWAMDDPTIAQLVYCWTTTTGTQSRRESGSPAQNFVDMTVGTWYFFGCVLDSAALATSRNYYMAAGGGTPTELTYNATAEDVITSTWVFRIGTNKGTNWLNGSIAAVKVWKAALTQAEINAERLTYAPVKTANLWANYQFRSGPQTTDDSGNSRTLTQTGTPVLDASGPPIT